MPVSTARSTAAQRIPSLGRHKATGQAFIRLDGRFIYLGAYDSPDTQQRYHRMVAEWLASGCQVPVDSQVMTVKELLARFWVHAEEYYASSPDLPAYEPDKYRRALRFLEELYSETKAADFGPLALQALARSNAFAGAMKMPTLVLITQVAGQKSIVD